MGPYGCNMAIWTAGCMRTLLRNVPTGLYVQSAEEWTGNPDEAYDFKTMSEAIRFVEKAGLRKMELAFVSPTCAAAPRCRWSC